MNKNGLPAPPAPELPPNIYVIPDGEQAVLLPKMAPLTGALADASYSFIAAAYSTNDSNPFSVRIARGYQNIAAPITIGDFLGVPRPTDPAPDQTASARRVVFAPEGPADGEPTFNLLLFRNQFGDDLARVFLRGNLDSFDIPDFTGQGFPAWPVDEDVSWTIYRITVEGGSFDAFTYRHLSALYWSAYTADAWWVRFPAP
jgi:hypothetical protein